MGSRELRAECSKEKGGGLGGNDAGATAPSLSCNRLTVEISVYSKKPKDTREKPLRYILNSFGVAKTVSCLKSLEEKA